MIEAFYIVSLGRISHKPRNNSNKNDGEMVNARLSLFYRQQGSSLNVLLLAVHCLLGCIVVAWLVVPPPPLLLFHIARHHISTMRLLNLYFNETCCSALDIFHGCVAWHQWKRGGGGYQPTPAAASYLKGYPPLLGIQ